MNTFESLKILGFDHLEFAVTDLEKSAEVYLRLGFEKVASREIRQRKLKSQLFVSSDIRILVSESHDPEDPVARFVAAHGDGVIDVAFLCESAHNTFEHCVRRGARVCQGPKSYTRDFGMLEIASIKTFADFRHTFISRKGNYFCEGFETPAKSHAPTYGLQTFDHLAINVETADLEKWVQYYERIFCLQALPRESDGESHHGRVLQSPTRGLRLAVNCPGAADSRLREFLTMFHGPGVEHVAFHSSDIVASLDHLRREKVRLLDVPKTYFDQLKGSGIPITENYSDLERLSIMAEGGAGGYLLHSLTAPAVGPLFFEIFQRKGDSGYGDRSLLQLGPAIELDQIRRGILLS